MPRLQTPIPKMFLPSHQPILHLPDGVPELIQATTALPTYSTFLAEVVHNAIDANASHISCWINPTCWSMRVTDDGQGISNDELKGGLGFEFGTSSKYRAARRGDADDDGFLGNRGRALASMGTLASLEIIYRRQGFTTTYHKSIKNGKVLSFARSDKYAKSSSGTTIILKDIYHPVRVKRTVGSKSSSTSTIQACKRAVEIAVLNYASNPSAKPHSLAITLTLEADPLLGTTSKRLLDIQTNTSDILQTFATLFGPSLTEHCKSFRTASPSSSLEIQVRGFISFVGHPTRAYQYVFMNGCFIEQSDLVEVVEGVFTRYSVLADEMEEEDTGRYGAAKREAGKGAGRSMKPVFLLHLIVSVLEKDVSLGPVKDVQNLKNDKLVRKVVASTLKNIIMSAKVPKPVPMDKTISAITNAAPVARSSLGHVGTQIASRRRASDLAGTSDVEPVVPAIAHTSFVDSRITSIIGDPMRNTRPEQKIGQTPEWLTRALSNRAHQVFSKASSSNLPTSLRLTLKTDAQEPCGRADTSLDQLGMARVQFSKQDLSHAIFLSQIDDKFICCLISHKDGRKTLVMIDQHAADERVRVERFLQETLQEFRDAQVASTTLGMLGHVVQLPLEQINWLMARPERLALFAKWGFQISATTAMLVKTECYSCITVNSVPTLLSNRLGPSGGKEVKGIIAGYIAFLQTQPDERIASLVDTCQSRVDCPGLDTDGLLRWMPKRMKELIDSKACRGAIMFNDPLTADKCKLLIKQLGKTSFPFICAHGRPSIFPVGQMPSSTVRTGHYNDPIDWTQQLLD